MTVNLFDANFYRLVNPDLANFTDQQALDHLLNFGLNEGRQFSPYVDLDLYQEIHPDLGAAGLTNNRQLYEHLQNFGVAEGRLFSIAFNPDFYREAYTDLQQAGLSNEQLFEHFQTFGLNEGRQGSEVFDVNFYLNSHPDLEAAGFTNRQLLEHFRLFGSDEGRVSSKLFNVQFYREIYPYLQQASLTNNRQAIAHFMGYGIGEQRFGEPSNSLFNIPDLGISEEPKSFRDYVSSSDPNDLYGFTLTTNSQVNLQLDGLSEDIQLLLNWDAFGSFGLTPGFEGISVPFTGFPIPLINQTGTSINPVEINQILLPGVYQVQVQSVGAFQPDLFSESILETNYNLTIQASPTTVSGDLAGNTLAAARDVGILSQELSFKDLVWIPDPVDFYRFTLTETSQLDLTVSSGEVELIQDRNNDGTIADDEILLSASGFTEQVNAPIPFVSRPATIEDATLLPGTYFIKIFPQGQGTEYELKMSATPFSLTADNAGNSLNEARDVDVLTGNQTVTDFVGSVVDSKDFYRFSLDSTKDVRINLADFITPDNRSNLVSSQGLNLRLIQDFNGNGLVEPNEVIAQNIFSDRTINVMAPEITQTLNPGAYFVGVALNVNPSYTLNFLL